jgi:DNA-binding CsgD family transcriptional regulator
VVLVVRTTQKYGMCRSGRRADTAGMPRGLTAERVRQDVDVLARGGLDLETFLEEATESVRRAVPWAAACLATQDPGTRLLTSARKYGHLRTVDSHDQEFALLEYGTVEPTTFAELAGSATPAAGVHATHGGEIERSGRMSTFMVPHFGFGDEARLVFLEGHQAWGAMALFRGSDDVPFAAEDTDFLASLSDSFARGVRSGLLARMAHTGPPAHQGPVVLVVGSDDRILQMSADAEARIGGLRVGDGSCEPTSVVGAVVGAARRYARGESAVPPRARVRHDSGQWLVVHASPLSGAGDRAGEVVVTIEEARPPEIVALVVAAFGLTQRERDVTQLVLQGVDTKEIAATLHVSTYTVQDHLKAVFDKADVRSRRELISRVYFDQYVPRMGAELSPGGWFA